MIVAYEDMYDEVLERVRNEGFKLLKVVDIRRKGKRLFHVFYY
jgi:hypothetical protein